MNPKVFTIPPHRAFADALAAGLIARFGRDTTGLARGIVLVPNNRAARAIQDAFVRRSGGGLLLPRLVPVGDPELDERIGGMLEPLDDETFEVNEGCLSVPGLRGALPRFAGVRVRFLDRHGARCELVVRGLTAGTFQHEVDHLDGVLFLDRVADPASFTTWEQFERFGREEFEAHARGIVERFGS